MQILIINGPNINFLGIRETGIYGSQSYHNLVNQLKNTAQMHQVDVDIFQSNHEGAILDKLQEAYHKKVDGIIINPGAFTHYSYAIRDGIASIAIPTIEVHISNVYKREEFRHHSVTAPVCIGQIAGLGLDGYSLAMQGLINIINNQE